MANTCAVTAEGGPPCGTVPEQLGSLISLDNLCMRALDGVRRALLADPDPDKRPIRQDNLEEPVHDEAVAFLDLLTLDLKNRLREHRSYLVDAEDNERPIETFSPQHYKSPTT
jgi:hypothetical protein